MIPHFQPGGFAKLSQLFLVGNQILSVMLPGGRKLLEPAARENIALVTKAVAAHFTANVDAFAFAFPTVDGRAGTGILHPQEARAGPTKDATGWDKITICRHC